MSDQKPYEPVHKQETSLDGLAGMLSDARIYICPLCQHKFNIANAFYVTSPTHGKIHLEYAKGFVHKSEWVAHIRRHHWGEDLHEVFITAALAAADTPKGEAFLWEAK